VQLLLTALDIAAHPGGRNVPAPQGAPAPEHQLFVEFQVELLIEIIVGGGSYCRVLVGHMPVVPYKALGLGVSWISKSRVKDPSELLC